MNTDLVRGAAAYYACENFMQRSFGLWGMKSGKVFHHGKVFSLVGREDL